MDKTIVVGSPNINGNIGSCEVKSNTFSLDSFHNQTVAVNSCTGDVVSQTIYFEYGIIGFPAVIIFSIILLKYVL